MILSDREIQAALELGQILIEPKLDPSVFSSTSLEIGMIEERRE
jgi:deoxycytidine triphosphate deaminase